MEAKLAICKSCAQTFDTSKPHDCPGLTTRPTADLGEDGELERIARAIASDIALQDGSDWTPPEDWDYRFAYLDQGEVDFKQIARAVLSRSGG